MAPWFAIPLALASATCCAADAPNHCEPPAGTQPFEFSSANNRLKGFVDLPPGGERRPAMLILHGSGTTDVFNADTFYNGTYGQLRATFRAAGFATVVWDKAGNGCSTGSYASGNPIRERATEALAALRALELRNDIDARHLGLWGISQGGWIGPMTALQSDAVSLLILVSTPARDAVSQLEFQALGQLRAQGIPESEVKVAATHLRRAFAIMRAGGAVEEYVSAVAPLQQYPALRALGITTGSPDDYLRWQNSMDYLYRPDTALRELRQPTLILFGENDALIDWRDSIRIYRDSFEVADNADLTVKVFQGTDHNLMTAGSDSQPVAGYLKTMTQWLVRHAGK